MISREVELVSGGDVDINVEQADCKPAVCQCQDCRTEHEGEESQAVSAHTLLSG